MSTVEKNKKIELPDSTNKELAAIGVIVNSLKGYSKENKQRILNTVSVYFDLEITWEN